MLENIKKPTFSFFESSPSASCNIPIAMEVTYMAVVYTEKYGEVCFDLM